MKRSFIIVNIILIALFLYFSVQAYSKISVHRSDLNISTDASDTQIVQSKTGEHHPFSYYSIIDKRNLFNTGKKANIHVDKVDIEELKQTKLKLKLLGTVTGNKNKAYAVIDDLKDRKQNLYRVGDSLQNATVKLILREKVVLNLNGKDEILGMKSESSTEDKTSVRKKRAVRSSKAVKSRSALKKAPSRSFKTRKSGRKRTVRSPKTTRTEGRSAQ